MKLRALRVGKELRVSISGLMVGSDCSCLEHFWSRRVASVDSPRIMLDLDGIEEIDAVAIAQLVTLTRRTARPGRPLTITAAPQMLAHTLYKIGALRHGSLTVDSHATEEPYAG
jgi:ABC-type transporter Mla MlaB component